MIVAPQNTFISSGTILKRIACIKSSDLMPDLRSDKILIYLAHYQSMGHVVWVKEMAAVNRGMW